MNQINYIGSLLTEDPDIYEPFDLASIDLVEGVSWQAQTPDQEFWGDTWADPADTVEDAVQDMQSFEKFAQTYRNGVREVPEWYAQQASSQSGQQYETTNRTLVNAFQEQVAKKLRAMVNVLTQNLRAFPQLKQSYAKSKESTVRSLARAAGPTMRKTAR